jgi:uncharacterized protein
VADPTSESAVAQVDYPALARFLIEPLLDQPEVLKIDCETHPQKPRVWVRLAFEGTDKGKVFGRGGRTIQAIRTVLSTAGQATGHTVHLEVFGEREHRESQREGHREGSRPRHDRGRPEGGQRERPSRPRRPE